MKIQLKRTSENLNNSDKMMETLVVEEKVVEDEELVKDVIKKIKLERGFD